LEGNISAIDTLIYEDIEEVSSFVATVSYSLDVPLWRLSGVLRQDVDRLVSQAWREAFVHVEEEEVPRQTPISTPIGLSPLDTTPLRGSILPRVFACWTYLVGSAPVW
jgi:hypothetical protein